MHKSAGFEVIEMYIVLVCSLQFQQLWVVIVQRVDHICFFRFKGYLS